MARGMSASARITRARFFCASALYSASCATAEAQKNRALVILAEADIPRAMADAFRGGNLGVMDFYRMKNLNADTDMRTSIGKGTA